PSTSLRPCRMMSSSALTVAEMPTVWAPARLWPGIDFALPRLAGTWPKPAWAASSKPGRLVGRSTELALDFGALSDIPVAALRDGFLSSRRTGWPVAALRDGFLSARGCFGF